MPIQIPAFVQYQAPLPPLRGLWNTPPAEGDRFVAAEIDWLNSPPGNAVQFQLSGNSPVAMSQIVALAVDNAGAGSDVQFLFPDSAFVLNVPSRSSGVYPVFTNALMFYASAPTAILGDRTVFQVFNSMPPPIQINESDVQQVINIAGVPLANGSTVVIPAGINGTVRGVAITGAVQGGASGGGIQIVLVAGSGSIIWGTGVLSAANTDQDLNYSQAPMSVRFTNGINLVLSGLSGTIGGTLFANVYYSIP